MVRCVLALFALLCGTQLALSQDPDCSTEAGRLAFLTESAKTDSDCYTPLFKLASSDDDYDISTKDVEAICKEDCVGEAVDFLTSTKECRNSAENKGIVSYLEDVLCSFEDINNPATSCVYYDTEDVSRYLSLILVSCARWWLEGASDSCPALPDGVSGVDSCEDVLKETYDNVKCCFVTFVSQEDVIQNITQSFIAGLREGGVTDIPDNLRVDLAADDLLEACGVDDVEPCPSTLEGDSAVIPVVMPLVVLLFALVSGVAA